MKKLAAWLAVVFLITGFFFSICAERYRNAVYWIEEGCFGKATSYVDEFPFLIELYDPGFVSYAYAGEAMGYGQYEKASELLKPLADNNYRDSIQMLEKCQEQLDKLKE